MRLSVDRAEAAAAMARINGVVLRRTTIPILSNVVLHANGALELRATDLDRQATVRVACDTVDEAEITVSAAALHDALRQSTAPTADLVMDGSRLKLTVGRASFRLPTIPAGEYPSIPVDGLKPLGEIAAEDLIGLIDATVHAASKDASRFSIMGVHLRSAGGEVIAVATDMKQMALHRVSAALEIESPITVPTPSLDALKRLAPDGSIVKVSGSEGLVRFEGDGWDLVSKVISDPFPHYELALKHPAIASFTVDPDDLLSAVRRAMIVAQDTSKSLSVVISPGQFMVAAAHGGAESGEPVDVDYEGDERRFGVPADKLMAAIEAAGADALQVDLTEFSLNIRPASKPTPLCLISLFRTN